MVDVNVTETNQSIAFIMCNIGEEGSPKVWYFKNGYSNHMSHNESFFSFICKNVKFEIKIGNNGIVLVMGKGSIIIYTNQGE